MHVWLKIKNMMDSQIVWKISPQRKSKNKLKYWWYDTIFTANDDDGSARCTQEAYVEMVTKNVHGYSAALVRDVYRSVHTPPAPVVVQPATRSVVIYLAAQALIGAEYAIYGNFNRYQ